MLLMIAGFDRYYQVVRCFRDEDLRADRQPEFTQVDLEMSFSSEEDIINLIEGMMAGVFEDILGVKIPLPLPRLEYGEAVERFGTDRPDTRFAMEMRDISDLAASSDFQVLRGVLQQGGIAKAINVPKGAGLFSRKVLDELSQFVVQAGANP